MPDEAPLEWTTVEEDELFLMANLYPKETGLPMTVWVSEHGGARHDVRVKVATTHGPRGIRPGEFAVVSVRPEPRLRHGFLARDDFRKVASWISLNEGVILDYWNGDASTGDLVQRLQLLPS